MRPSTSTIQRPARRAAAAPVRSGAPDTAEQLAVIGCPDPECGAPAELFDRITIDGTGGPIAHARTRCLNRHHFFLPQERITLR